MITERPKPAQVAERFPDIPEGDSPFERMIQGLRRKNSKVNAICTEVLVRSQTELGANVVRPLIIEATLPGKRPDHRIRILDVVQRIGCSLDADDFFTVMTLTSHPVNRVARKAAELLVALRPKSSLIRQRCPGEPPATPASPHPAH